MAQKKVYVIDPGIGSALDFKLSKDLGKLLETTVALDLQKKELNIAYQSNGFECDFVIRKDGEVQNLIQVAWSMEDESTRSREIKGLVGAAKKYNLKAGIILTMSEKENFMLEDISISIVPAWEYLTSI